MAAWMSRSTVGHRADLADKPALGGETERLVEGAAPDAQRDRRVAQHRQGERADVVAGRATAGGGIEEGEGEPSGTTAASIA